MTALARNWEDDSTANLIGAIAGVVRRVSLAGAGRDVARSPRLTEKKENLLERAFHDASMSLGTFEQYMQDVAEKVMEADPEQAVKLAPLKDRRRAAAKIGDASRNAFGDVARGRIVFDNVQEYKRFVSCFENGKSSHPFHDEWAEREGRSVRLQQDSISNYLRNPRKASGYAGSINLNVEVDCKKGRSGTAEIQVMPRALLETDRQSHLLFEMIRDLSEKPKEYRTAGEEKLRRALVAYNTALWDEAARNNDLLDLRNEQPAPIDMKDAIEHSNTIGMLIGYMERTNPQARTTRLQATIDALNVSQKAFVAKQTRQPEGQASMKLETGWTAPLSIQSFQPAATLH